MVTGAHEVGHLGAGGDGAHGEAVGDALGHAHDVRLDAGALEAERGATAEEAGLDLVDDEQDALLVAEVGDGAQIVVGGRPDAALALDALEHDGADGAAAGSGVLHGLAQRVDVVEVNGGKARRQRLEALVEDVLTGGGERGQRAAVEALVGAHDTRGAVELDLAPAAGDLDGALVCLGARVTKEHAPGGAGGALDVAGLVGHRGEQAGDGLCRLVAVLDVEVVAHLPEPLGLVAHGGHDGRMAVTQAGAANAAKEVQVVLAGGVSEHGALCRDELHGQAAVGVHEVGLVGRDDVGGNGGKVGHGVLFLDGTRGRARSAWGREPWPRERPSPG